MSQREQLKDQLDTGTQLYKVIGRPGRLRQRWHVFRIRHYSWSLIWWSRCWRWKIVKRGYLPLPPPEVGSPPLKPSDLFKLRRANTSEWEDRHLLRDVWFGVWFEQHPEEHG